MADRETTPSQILRNSKSTFPCRIEGWLNICGKFFFSFQDAVLNSSFFLPICYLYNWPFTVTHIMKCLPSECPLPRNSLASLSLSLAMPRLIYKCLILLLGVRTGNKSEQHLGIYTNIACICALLEATHLK